MEKEYIKEYVDYLTEDLDKTNISHQLFLRFKDLIIEGKLPTGYMLPNENTVSELLHVGRSTLREAYTALAVFGFIKRSKAGTIVCEVEDMIHVAPFSMTVQNSELHDLLEFRYMLEAETASYAAKRATAEDITKIRDAYEQMIFNKSDVNLFCDADSKFHTYVSEASHNMLLHNTMMAAKESFEHGIRLAMRESLTQNPKAIEVTLDLHGKLLHAIEIGDYQKAYALMREHISYVNLTVKYG